MKKAMILTAAALAAAVSMAAPNARGPKKGPVIAAGGEDLAAGGAKIKLRVDQLPKLGRSSTAVAPSIGESPMGPSWNGKPRRWIVMETKYQTMDKCIDQLTFTWHVLLETKTATVNDKEGRAKLPPYSYMSQTVTYVNIPRGTHAASVCAHPSFLEQYGEPKAYGLVITDANGELVGGDSESQIPDVKSHTRWWENPKIMDAKQPNGEPFVERRAGLVDRSKTIWAMVYPNDYEMVAQ